VYQEYALNQERNLESSEYQIKPLYSIVLGCFGIMLFGTVSLSIILSNIKELFNGNKETLIIMTIILNPIVKTSHT